MVNEFNVYIYLENFYFISQFWFFIVGAKTRIGPCEGTFNTEKGKEAQLQCIVDDAYPDISSYKWSVTYKQLFLHYLLTYKYKWYFDIYS